MGRRESLRKRCLPNRLFCQQHLAKIWLSVGPFFHSFDHNFLVSRPFWARKVSNRSSHCALQNGPGAVSSIQFSVWSTVRSNLGQTWSTLVEFGQNSPNSGKCIPNRVSRVFGPGGPQSGWERLGQTLVKLRSTLVKLGQPWSNLGKCVLDLLLRSV
jgi:hypothetical protein